MSTECHNCGAQEGHIIPVWESDEKDGQPKYVGCTECHTMMLTRLLRGEDDEVPPQLPITPHEKDRLRTTNQYGSQGLTIIEWQCVKGAASMYSVSDWTSKVDATLTKEENVSLMEEHSGEGKTLRRMKQATR